MTDLLTAPHTEPARSPLTDAHTQLADAITALGYGQGMFDLLATPRRELTAPASCRRSCGDWRAE